MSKDTTTTPATLRHMARNMYGYTLASFSLCLENAANTIENLHDELEQAKATAVAPPAPEIPEFSPAGIAAPAGGFVIDVEGAHPATDALTRDCSSLAVRVHELEAAIKSALSWVEIRHRPAVRDPLESGRMVSIRLHALSDLTEVYANRAPTEHPAQVQVEALKAENTQLRKALAGEISSETLMTDLALRSDGLAARFEGGLAHVVAESFAKQFRDSGGVNYLEMSFTAEDGLNVLVTIQNIDGRTPAQFRADAEASANTLRQLVKSMALEIAEQAAKAISAAENAANAALYRFIRTLSAHSFAEIFQENLRTGKPFDGIVKERAEAQNPRMAPTNPALSTVSPTRAAGVALLAHPPIGSKAWFATLAEFEMPSAQELVQRKTPVFVYTSTATGRFRWAVEFVGTDFWAGSFDDEETANTCAKAWNDFCAGCTLEPLVASELPPSAGG